MSKEMKKASDINVGNLNLPLLVSILERIRTSNSQGEAEFVQWLKHYLGFTLGKSYQEDSYGNIWVSDPESKTLFTSHTDTVHGKKVADQHKIQQLMLDENQGQMFLADPKAGYVLGADCGTGVFIMLEMLKHGTKGNYVFFRDEEVGGLGSSHATSRPEELKGLYDRVISFDRKDTCSVITHQGMTRCCSEEFSNELSKRLTEGSGGQYQFQGDDGGTFTDSANYTSIVPECTNLSVGYYSQHSKNESQDINFLQVMVPVFCELDWESLPTVRDPSVVENLYTYGRYGFSYEQYYSPRRSSNWGSQFGKSYGGLDYEGYSDDNYIVPYDYEFEALLEQEYSYPGSLQSELKNMSHQRLEEFVLYMAEVYYS